MEAKSQKWWDSHTLRIQNHSLHTFTLNRIPAWIFLWKKITWS